MIIIIYKYKEAQVEHVIKIVERNVNSDYSVAFKNVFDKFIDKFSRDVLYKIIHEIYPKLK
jgi:hypothetical protein